MTVLFVEHDMHMVRHIADWVIVMAEGKIVAEGDPHTVMQDPAVIDAYLGAHHDADLGDRHRARRGDSTGAGIDDEQSNPSAPSAVQSSAVTTPTARSSRSTTSRPATCPA